MSHRAEGVWARPFVRHVFVDESIRRDGLYRMTAVAVPAAELANVTRALRARTPAGSRRVHFSSESEPRRRATLRCFADLPIEAVTFIAAYPVRSDEEAARAVCLRGLVALSAGKVACLTLDSRGPDRDKRDRRIIRDALEDECWSDVTYSHRGSRDEVLLGLPDAVGWAVGAKGRWWGLVSGFTTVFDVSG